MGVKDVWLLITNDFGEHCELFVFCASTNKRLAFVQVLVCTLTPYIHISKTNQLLLCHQSAVSVSKQMSDGWHQSPITFCSTLPNNLLLPLRAAVSVSPPPPLPPTSPKA